MQEQRCCRCGMDKHDWKGNGGDGYMRNGEPYCCRGCAEGTGCTCR